MSKVYFKYLMTYILPLPLYAIFLLIFMLANAQSLENINPPEIIFYIAIIIEMTILISTFNYFLPYKSSLKYIEIPKAKKIFRYSILLNIVLLTTLMIFIKIITS